MKVLVLGAAGPAGVNTCRALHRAGHDVVAADANELHLPWVTRFAEPLHLTGLTVDVVNDIGADVMIPQPDTLAHWVALARDEFAASVFLPSLLTIQKCQEKLVAQNIWHAAGLREYEPLKVQEPYPDWLHVAADRFGLPFWLRATRGAGAKGATLVPDLRTAYHWVRYWETRGEQYEWMAEEYLPGRDYAWTSLWHNGDLVTSFARERLEYLYPHLTPDGLTGTPTVARVVHDENVNRAAVDAVLAIDAKPHGIMSVDLREDAFGNPRPTEINAGRGFTTLGLWSLHKVNFLDLAVRLARDGKQWWLIRPDLPEPEKYDTLPEGLTLSRHIDCAHVLSHSLVIA